MDDSFMYAALAVLVVMIAVGIIALLIMKKVKAHENVITITILATLFCGLLASGALVYIVSLGMMKDYIAIKRYADPVYIFNEDSSRMIIVKEYSNSDCSGFEVMLKNSNKVVADIETDAYLPFSAKEYKTEWKDEKATIYFTFENSGDAYKSKYIVIDTNTGSVSESRDSDIDLRPKEEASQIEQSEAA